MLRLDARREKRQKKQPRVPENKTGRQERNKIMKIFLQTTCLALCFCLVTVTGCVGGKTPDRADLLYSRFVLETVDGKPFVTPRRMPDLEFGENFRVSGQICNRFFGQGELVDGILTVKQMGTTKMLCPEEELNSFENQFALMLMSGAAVELSGDLLTLSQGGHVLVYRLLGKVN